MLGAEEEKQDEAEGEHDEVVEHEGCPCVLNGCDGGRDADDTQDVERDGADDVAHRHVRLPLSGGDDGGEEFGQRCAHGHDGEADDALHFLGVDTEAVA